MSIYFNFRLDKNNDKLRSIYPDKEQDYFFYVKNQLTTHTYELNSEYLFENT